MVSDIKIVSVRGKQFLVIGKRKYRLEEIDENYYTVVVPGKILAKYKFSDLPFPGHLGEEVVIEYLPFTKKTDEYLYEARGLVFFDEASLWRNREKGHVYLGKTIPTYLYAYEAWIPIDLYSWIISKIAVDKGFTVEVNREEKAVIIEIEKTYPLEQELKEVFDEIKNLDKEVARTLSKLAEKIKKSDLKIIAKQMNIEPSLLEEILKNPEEKISTLP